MSENFISYVVNAEGSGVESTAKAIEKLRETVIHPVEELTNNGNLKGARVLLFGSAVSELREPSDLDTLLIFDSFADSTEKSELTDEAMNFRKEIISSTVSASLSSFERAVRTIKYDDVDVIIIRKDALEKLLGRSREENQDYLIQGLISDMRLPAMLLDAYDMGYDLNNTWGEEASLPDSLEALGNVATMTPLFLAYSNGFEARASAVEMARDQSSKESDIDVTDLNLHYSAFMGPSDKELGATAEDILEQAVTRFSNELDKLDPELAGDFSRLFSSFPEGNPTEEQSRGQREVMMRIVAYIARQSEQLTQDTDANKLGSYISKRIRRGVHAYSLGVNFVQGALSTSAVLIHGEDLELSIRNTEGEVEEHKWELDERFL